MMVMDETTQHEMDRRSSVAIRQHSRGGCMTSISVEDFAKLDIRIGTVKAIERVPNADKLLKFIFDVGGETRQIMASMAPFFDNLDGLIDKQMPLLLNIKPRTFRGYESQGMIIAADYYKQRPVFLVPEEPVLSGTQVR